MEGNRYSVWEEGEPEVLNPHKYNSIYLLQKYHTMGHIYILTNCADIKELYKREAPIYVI